ncbi:helix-turn-helix domain-containing protein [Shouchella hunanensis]|uniref:Helix-turn-helix transcriptional regulator n=1 Tax=Shouchella hunanensis TaxID=766894 RepID=A0ABY7W209_9BACI|nr:helix-turn-helix transcriptional regulator [Shouchella hunanensis]WDF02972.1 helix-turn-helix transcriptional regulator [Shouchella hunanensis]
MLSAFGKFVRKLRIDNGELLKEMADKLGVTSSYLSAVENNKRNVPQGWSEIIIKNYALNEFEAKQLEKAIEESIIINKIDLNQFGKEDKNIVKALARELKSFDEADRKKLIQLLNKERG